MPDPGVAADVGNDTVLLVMALEKVVVPDVLVTLCWSPEEVVVAGGELSEVDVPVSVLVEAGEAVFSIVDVIVVKVVGGTVVELPPPSPPPLPLLP